MEARILSKPYRESKARLAALGKQTTENSQTYAFITSVMEIENRSCIIDSSGSSRNVSRSDGRVSGACSSLYAALSSFFEWTRL
ncbi:hypothetical protein T03_10971 [Trichinella britovi]|uniref:Uncharacterized protein n=1 Tax=Trichinella britovi TaxID=45882 RepID=A0A0V1DAK9_TRIBR|nr:hypothetical protein T03_10971 [Trichinella britovi]